MGRRGFTALLFLQGTNDGINPWSLTQRLYDVAITPKWLVSIAGAGHLAPYTAGAQEDTIVDLVAAAGRRHRYPDGFGQPIGERAPRQGARDH